MRTTDRRRGFTLIELLVVIGLLAILSAISVAAFFKIRNAQQSTATDQLLLKVNTALDRQWTAARDQADKEFKDSNLPGGNDIDKLISFAAGDRDRARSLWIYLRLKNEFPQNFYEAKNPTVLRDSTNAVIISLPAKKTFTATSAVTSSNGRLPSTDDMAAAESAALLYTIVTDKASRGEAFGDEALGAAQATVQLHGTNLDAKAFTDTWGTPIAYVRFATNTEIRSAPYAKSATIDPLDPIGRLKIATWTNRVAAANWLFLYPITPPPQYAVLPGDYNPTLPVANPPLTAMPATNWLPTAVAAGPEKTFENSDITLPTYQASRWFKPSANGLVEVPYNAGFSLGYRVKREGSKGE